MTTNSQMIGAEHQQESDQNFHKSSRVSAAGLHGPRLVHTRSLFKLPQGESCHWLSQGFWVTLVDFTHFHQENGYSHIDSHLIFEISSSENQVQRTKFLVHFELDFYCPCSLQKSSSKRIINQVCWTWFYKNQVQIKSVPDRCSKCSN